MGGTISLDSREGAGTTVTIDLHMNFANTIQAKEETRVDNQTTVQNRRLLLVQKNPLELLVLRKLLESKGASITYVESMEEALDALHNNASPNFNFIIVDIDNFHSSLRADIIQQLKMHPHFGKSILFALCTNVDLDEKKALVDAGVDEVLFKPLRFASLLSIMDEYKK